MPVVVRTLHTIYLLVAFSVCAMPNAKANELAAKADFFHEQVEPILISHCLECHASDKKGGLDLRSIATATEGGESGPSLEPGEPEASLLYEYVSGGEMPPEKPLDEQQVAVLKKWIEGRCFLSRNTS